MENCLTYRAPKSSKVFRKERRFFSNQKIASKALPGGLPGQIAFQVGKCAIEEVW